MFGIDIGPSSGEQSNYGSLVSSSGAATEYGLSDLGASSRFMQAVLSGDASKITSVLSPLISSAKTSAQQTQKTGAEMGTRSGGTAATNAAAADKVHSDITSAIAGLTGNAATTLGSEGAGLLATGISGNAAGFDEAKQIQAQRAAKWNELIKQIAATAAGAITGGAAGGLGGALGGAVSAVGDS